MYLFLIYWSFNRVNIINKLYKMQYQTKFRQLAGFLTLSWNELK